MSIWQNYLGCLIMLTPSLIQDINHNSLHCSGFDSPNDPHTNIIVNFTLIDKGSFALGDDDDDKKNGLHGNQWDCSH